MITSEMTIEELADDFDMWHKRNLPDLLVKAVKTGISEKDKTSMHKWLSDEYKTYRENHDKQFGNKLKIAKFDLENYEIETKFLMKKFKLEGHDDPPLDDSLTEADKDWMKEKKKGFVGSSEELAMRKSKGLPLNPEQWVSTSKDEIKLPPSGCIPLSSSPRGNYFMNSLMKNSFSSLIPRRRNLKRDRLGRWKKHGVLPE